MKKASKKLFKSSPSKDSSSSSNRQSSINGRSTFSSAAASALSLSPVAEDHDDQADFNKAFYSSNVKISDVDRRVRTSLNGGQFDYGSVRRHPGELESNDGIARYEDEGRKRREMLQMQQLEKWEKAQSSRQQQRPPARSSESSRSSRSKKQSFHEAYKDYDRMRREDSLRSPRYSVNTDHIKHMDSLNEGRGEGTPKNSLFGSTNSTTNSNDLQPNNEQQQRGEQQEEYTRASSKQKKSIDNYVQAVIANSSNDEYVTPLPRMDSGMSGFFSNSSHGEDNLKSGSRHSGRNSGGRSSSSGRGSSSSTGEAGANENNSLLPLPGFGEVDLLQRAIERRTLLHDRIVKMEAASAEFAREEQDKQQRNREGTPQRKRDGRRESGKDGRKKENSRFSVTNVDGRMNMISERIKKEALEFLNFDESQRSGAAAVEEGDEGDGDEGNLTEEDNATRDPSDDEQQQQHENLENDATNENDPTPQQLARYSNMVRLGIPDLAILRSMERDGIDSHRVSGILDSLKNRHVVVDGSNRTSEDKIIRTAPSDEFMMDEGGKKSPARNIGNSPARSNNGNSPARPSTSGHTRQNSSLPPLKDDPNYNKYFKMLRAKVPLSWVKRVLEVDGKDARVLDLDPDKPLSEQIAGAGVDSYGNVDWNKVVIFRTGSGGEDESSGDEIMGRGDKQLDATASVKAELAIMTAKAGRMSRESSRQSSTSDSSKKERAANPEDISSAAVAASNARLDRLKAISTPDRGIRRKQSVDEIRRRPPPPPPRTPKPTPTNLPSSSEKSIASNERHSRRTHEHLPLKDDPRFSKYFQMIRSRVPRSWVERVIEVDDRDPAILDLDPNKPLAAQVDDDDKSIMRTVATETDGSLDEESGVLDVSGVSKEDLLGKGERSEDVMVGVGGDDGSPVPPIMQIVNADDERSIASSITNFKDATPSQAESNAVLDRISAFLDKIEARSKDNADGVPNAVEGLDAKPASQRLTSPEDIEDKLTSLIDRFESREEPVQTTKEEVDEQQQFVEKHKSDIAKLSSLLASKLGQETGASLNDEEQSDLGKLSSLLTEVLAQMEGPSSAGDLTPPGKLGKNSALEALFAKKAADQEPSESTTTTPPRSRRNSALEALFAKKAALAEEQEAPILKEDTEYQKYFKMKKMGMPRPVIEQALERDGKDVSILDLDPDRPLAEQQQQQTKQPQEEEKPKPNKNAALESLFASRAAAMQQPKPPKESEVLLKNDPEYQKYFKMLKVGMPRDAVEQALERDGKSKSILDLDPEKPYASQVSKDEVDEAKVEAEEKSEIPIKDDPEYAKFFKMRKMGIPLGAVKQALQKEGKDPGIIDFDPEKSYASQSKKQDDKKPEVPIKDDPEYAKFFKMLKMGIPLGAVKQALQKEGKDPSIVDLDPEKSYASQTKKDDKPEVPLKDDPEYAKFFKMLKMGIPPPAVKQALQKEGKDPNVIDMDPEKSYASQTKKKDDKKPDVPLKDDPEYAKFFKMLKMGIPPPAVKQAMQKEGKDPSIIDLDPEKPLSQQQSKPGEAKKTPKVNNGPKVARKRLHWNKIDESKLNENSFWNQAKDEHASLQLVGLDVDNEEFASLFTAQVNKSAGTKKKESSSDKKPGNQKVQLIDGRRRMNGSILLTKFKVNYKVLARQVDNMEHVEADSNELRGMMQLLPTKDESLALRSYLPPADSPQSVLDDAIDKLGECEQYMAVMLDVPDAKEKFECMLFRTEFETQIDSIRDGTKLLKNACNSVQNSVRFKKLLMYALKLGNALNTDASGAEAAAITLDSLLKMAEAKAFDRQTSVLHYLVSIVSKNDSDVLKLSEDFDPVRAAERVAVDMLSQHLRELGNGIKLVKEMSKKYASSDVIVEYGPEDETPEVELLSTSPMGKFALSAESKITSLATEFEEAKQNFADLLEFFGEDPMLTPEAFFCTINTFVAMFDQTNKELIRKEEAKERKKRIEEKRKLREEAAKEAKAKS